MHLWRMATVLRWSGYEEVACLQPCALWLLRMMGACPGVRSWSPRGVQRGRGALRQGELLDGQLPDADADEPVAHPRALQDLHQDHALKVQSAGRMTLPLAFLQPIDMM